MGAIPCGCKSMSTGHNRTHNNVKLYKYDECEKYFRRNNTLIRHKRFNKGEKPYSCDKCEKSFSQRRNLAKHKRIHSDDRTGKISRL